MKKNILIFLSIIICLSANAASISETSRDIKLQVEKSGTPILKNSILPIPVEASIEGNVVSVSFLFDLNATVRITSVETGKVIYEYEYSAIALSVLPISLEGEDLGDYKIEISYEGTVVYGEFVLY